MTGKAWLAFIAAAAGLLLASGAAAQSIAPSGLAGEKVQLSAADIAALPHQPVTLQLEGKSEACDGVPLSLILAKAGAPQGKALRGAELADVVLIGAADGYHVAMALAETDPVMRGDKVFLADHCGGGPDGGARRAVPAGGAGRRPPGQVGAAGDLDHAAAVADRSLEQQAEDLAVAALAAALDVAAQIAFFLEAEPLQQLLGALIAGVGPSP